MVEPAAAAVPLASRTRLVLWRRLLPGTLYGQVLAALLVGLFTAQAIGAWIVLGDRAAFAERMAGGHAAQRIAAILGALDHIGDEGRHHVLRALDLPPTRLALNEPWQSRTEPPSETALAFEGEMREALDAPLAVQVLSIQREALPWPRDRDHYREVDRASGQLPPPPGVPPPMPLPMQRRLAQPAAGAPWEGRPRHVVLRVMLQARLTDGTVVSVRQALPAPPGDQPLRLLGWLAAVMVLMAVLAGWIVRRLTRPLAGFAAAATGLARDLDQPPLPENGPREISAAALAFNRMQHDLRQLLETRAQALAAVSHDLRLPLTRVRLRIDALPEAPMRQAIEADLDDMDRMIGNTLDFLRAGRSREPTVLLDLDALVESVAGDLEPLGAEIVISGSSGPPVMARPQVMRRCLANLLDNARRYGAPGPVDVALRDQGSRVDVDIMDRGPGIAPEDRDRVFEPYVRLETSRAQHTGGTGLGLAIARAIARAHGGDVSLGAREGGGLVARLWLPRNPKA